MMKKWVLAAAICLTSLSAMAASDPDNTLVMKLKDGTVEIQLLPQDAPQTVARIKELTRKGFYDGTPFHRVIDGFMAQGGDPTGTGTGGSGQPIPDEFNNEPHVRGAVSMANSGQPNSQDSQFFIVLKDSRFLDHKYTVFGRVIGGMQYVDAIKKGNANENGTVADPDKILSMKVESDIAGAK